MTAPFTTETERRGNTVLITLIGHLDCAAAAELRQALRDVTSDAAVLMVDLHQMPFMDTSGLLLLLDLHRRAECLGLRVLAVGWQAQPQQLMATVAGMPGPGSSTGERYALAAFRHLIEGRAERARVPHGAVTP